MRPIKRFAFFHRYFFNAWSYKGNGEIGLRNEKWQIDQLKYILEIKYQFV
jgi:hypothetical protein